MAHLMRKSQKKVVSWPVVLNVRPFMIFGSHDFTRHSPVCDANVKRAGIISFRCMCDILPHLVSL